MPPIRPRTSPNGRTLPQVLTRRAAAAPDKRHLVLLEGDRQRRTLTFGELLDGAQAVARGLDSRGIVPGQTVALMLPTGEEFFFGFMGVLLAGAVPVPIYPPVQIDQLEEYAERQVNILRNAEVVALLTPRRATKLARLLRPRVPSLEHILRPDRLFGRKGKSAPDPAASRDPAAELGLIQYTSGSTGDPKGVALTHDNLLSNVHSIGEAVAVRDDDIVVSWLPLYHDMGLIGCWLFAVVHGLEMVCFSPLDFLRRPVRWLRAVSEYGGTLSPAPNFAYELCVRRIRDRDLAGLDLSTWRVALNGAEPVNPETLERFQGRFGALGFNREALMPVYGLAENAVALTFPPLGRPPRIEMIQRDTFHLSGRAVPLADGEAGGDGAEPLRTVSVGAPIPGNEIRVVDDDDREVDERVEGNIQFRGPSATAGYFRNPDASAKIQAADGWTRTGDRGYLADGELYVTGRRKDVIIKGGRNLDPAEIEALAAEVSGVRRGCVAAIAVANPTTGSEDLVVIAETRKTEAKARSRLATAVRRRIQSAIRVSPDNVLLVPPRTLPKTPSGKLRRAETRGRYLSRTLRQRRPPAWVQIARLAAGAGWLSLLALLWRRRPRD